MPVACASPASRAPWRLEDFDFEAHPGLDRTLVTDLATLRFLDEAANVLFIGPPGVGKTHVAIALGQLAIDAGIDQLRKGITPMTTR